MGMKGAGVAKALVAECGSLGNTSVSTLMLEKHIRTENKAVPKT